MAPLPSAEPGQMSAAQKSVETRQAKKAKRVQAVEKGKATREANKQIAGATAKNKPSEAADEKEIGSDTELLDLKQLDVRALGELVKNHPHPPVLIELYCAQTADHETPYLVPESFVSEDAAKVNHPVLGWSKPGAWQFSSVDAQNKATWPQSYTQLTDFDVARVVQAGIKTSERGRLWPATFDTNGNPRTTRRSLGIPAVMEYEGELYTLVYKQKYRLHGENAADLALVPGSVYRTTNVNGAAQDLVIGSKYTATRSVPTLPTAKEFLRNYGQDVVDALGLTHTDYHTIYKSDSQEEGHHSSLGRKDDSEVREVKGAVGPIPQKSRKAPGALPPPTTYGRKTRQKPIEFDLLDSEEEPIKPTTKASGSTPLKRKASAPILPEKTPTKPEPSDKVAKIRGQILAAMTPTRESTPSSPADQDPMLTEAAKLFRTVGTLVGEAYDKSAEVDARFGAIAISALSALDDDDQEYKTRVLQNLAEFAQLSTGLLRQTLKAEHSIRDNVHRISRHMHDAYNDASTKAYRGRSPAFYDGLSTMDDWPIELKKYDEQEDDRNAELDKDSEIADVGPSRPLFKTPRYMTK